MSTGVRREVPRLALNQQEAAESLGVSVDHFERHVKPHVEYVLLGSRRLYSVRELQRFLEHESLKAGRRAA